jgi:hypothetical protein
MLVDKQEIALNVKKPKKIPKAKKKNPKKTTLYPIPHDCVPTFPLNPTLTLLLYPYAFHIRLL